MKVADAAEQASPRLLLLSRLNLRMFRWRRARPLPGTDLRPPHPRLEASQSLATCRQRMRAALENTPDRGKPGRSQVTRDSHFLAEHIHEKAWS